MEIVVLSASRQKNCTLKDAAGGFGTVFIVGNSPFARLLEIAKRRIASIPTITFSVTRMEELGRGEVSTELEIPNINSSDRR